MHLAENLLTFCVKEMIIQGKMREQVCMKEVIFIHHQENKFFYERGKKIYTPPREQVCVKEVRLIHHQENKFM